MNSLAYQQWTPDPAERDLVKSLIVTYEGDERRFWVEGGRVHVACDWWAYERWALLEEALPAQQPTYSKSSLIPYTKIPFELRVHLNRVRIALLRARAEDDGFPADPVETSVDLFRRDLWAAAAELAGATVHEAPQRQLVLTHDLDEEYGWPGVGQIRQVERDLGVVSATGVLSQRYTLPESALQGLVDDGCEVFSHGYLHDGTLAFLPADELRRRLGHFFEAYPSMRGVVRGFRAGQLVRSQHMFKHVGEFFDYDMTPPTTEVGGAHGWRTGCATTVPFVDDHGLPHLPLSIVQDYFLQFIDRMTPAQITALWVESTQAVWDAGGVAVHLVHPDNVRRRPQLLAAYRDYLEVVLDRGAEVRLPGDVMTSLGVRR